MPQKLRLVLWSECNRSCEGCCNQDWDVDNLPIATSFDKYDEILLTGGEPMLYPEELGNIIRLIRGRADAKIFVYTASPTGLEQILHLADGITVTLHEQEDVGIFNEFSSKLPVIDGKSLRLNVFKGIDTSDVDISDWIVKDDIEWIADCPLPENEEIKRWTG